MLAKEVVLSRRRLAQETEIEYVERTAIIVRPKEPYYAWARGLAANSAIDVLSPHERRQVYLVDQKYVRKPEKMLRRNFGRIFADQLNGWWRAEEDWPSPRTWAMFQEWFEADVIETVRDAGIGPLPDR
jgi:hypothetical protein